MSIPDIKFLHITDLSIEDPVERQKKKFIIPICGYFCSELSPKESSKQIEVVVKVNHLEEWITINKHITSKDSLMLMDYRQSFEEFEKQFSASLGR